MVVTLWLVLNIIFFREGHPRKSTVSLNSKISDNDHKITIYISTLLLKKNMYEATVLKNALKNRYSCKTSVIEYKYQYSS